MTIHYVYLAGPILGKTFREATEWRQHAASMLDTSCTRAVDPMRDEMDTRKSVKPHPWVPRKNLFDLRRCDIVLAYEPKDSAGTMMEIGAAWALGKPVVLVAPSSPLLWVHPCVADACLWRGGDLNDGIAAVLELASCSRALPHGGHNAR